jgi:chorismate mutase/prephenate dehydratase
MNEKSLTIQKVRSRIDEIDNTILKLLEERLGCAGTIGRLKTESNRAKWDPKRELEIYERLLNNNKKNKQVFPEESLKSIFHEIITTCRLSQKKIAVAYLGPEATFTHLAGIKYFGRSADHIALETIDDVFNEVDKERLEYGIVPVENSIEGSVFSTLDSFIKYNVKICGELQLPISHNLICKSGNIADIQSVASHPQPLAQCREWLRKHLPGIPTIEVFSTGAAAKMAANNPNIGAIASSLAIKTYNIQEVVKGIEDYRGNTTRFLVIGKQSPPPCGNDKTSVLLSLRTNRPGALKEVLCAISDRNIDLTKIESRPIKSEKWKYLFFLDIAGHIEDNLINECCETLKKNSSFFEWIGSYPRGKQL